LGAEEKSYCVGPTGTVMQGVDTGFGKIWAGGDIDPPDSLEKEGYCIFPVLKSRGRGR